MGVTQHEPWRAMTTTDRANGENQNRRGRYERLGAPAPGPSWPARDQRERQGEYYREERSY